MKDEETRASAGPEEPDSEQFRQPAAVRVEKFARHGKTLGRKVLPASVRRAVG